MKKPISSRIKQLLYNETAPQKILKTLFLKPEVEFSLSQIALESSVRKENIGHILKQFEKEDIIRITRLKTIWQIHANLQSELFIRLKIAYNLQNIYNSGVINILNEYYNNPKAIVLFGSYRKGEDISTSDIDIAIEDNSLTEYVIIEATKLTEKLKETEKYLQRKIQVHAFNRKFINKHLFNNIANGIVLVGFLEVNL